MAKTLHIALGLLLLAGPALLRAQSEPPIQSPGQSQPRPAAPRFDLAFNYTAQRSLEAVSSQNFWSQGGSFTAGSNLWRGWGPAVDLTGTHAGAIGTGNTALSLLTTTFGLRYRWHGAHRYSLYGQGLAGVANGFDSDFPKSSGSSTSAHSLALLFGGGLDLHLSPRFSARLLDADYLRTTLPNDASNVQNNLRISAGIVFHFGHPTR